MTDALKRKLFFIIPTISLLAVLGMALYVIFLQGQLAVAGQDSQYGPRVQALLEGDRGTPDPQAADPFAAFLGAPRSPFTSGSIFSEMQALMDEMSQRTAITGFPGIANSRMTFGGDSMLLTRPQIQVREEADKFEVAVTIPEGQEIQLNTSVEDDVLRLTGLLTLANSQQSSGRWISSSASMQFSESIPFNEDINELGVYTTTDESQIRIVVPKAVS